MQTGYSKKDRLYFEEMGSGQPVLLLHGFGGNTYSWRFQMEILSESNRVIGLDLRGFGKSPKPDDNRYTFRDHVEMVKQFIYEMSLSHIVLVGHSYGGSIALGLILDFKEDHPEIVDKLVIIAGAAYPQHLPSLARIMRTSGIGNLTLKSLSEKKIVKWILKQMYHKRAMISQSTVSAYATPLKEDHAKKILMVTAENMIPQNPETYVKKYRNIDIPALLIWGENDSIVPLGYGRRLAKSMKNAHLKVIQECGHIPQEEKPVDVNQFMVEFIHQ